MPIAFIDLAHSCAPTVAVETLAGVVGLESRFEPLAVRINTDPTPQMQPATKAEAIEMATSLVAEGHDIQLGLGGVGMKELRKLNLSISDAFDPCLNLKATATLLDGHYRLAVAGGADEKRAEQVMLQSWYGRGDSSVGEMVSYDEQVRKEIARLGETLATLTVSGGGQGRGPGQVTGAEMPVTEAKDNNPPTDQTSPAPSWDVFRSRQRSSVLVFQNNELEQSE